MVLLDKLIIETFLLFEFHDSLINTDPFISAVLANDAVLDLVGKDIKSLLNYISDLGTCFADFFGDCFLDLSLVFGH